MVNIRYHEITDESFSAVVELQYYNVEVEGSVWLDEENELWGDQVSATHTIAKFDELTDMKVFSHYAGSEALAINLEFAEFVKSQIEDDMAEIIESVKHEVDRSPHYYDLV